MGFQTRVPRLCALKENACFPHPVKKKCSFVYNYPLKRYTVFPNYLLDVQRTGDMGTPFFTPLCQIKCKSLATAAIKENSYFLYLQKKVMSLLTWAGPPESLAAYPRSAFFPNNVFARTFVPPDNHTHLLHKCLGKAFPNYRGVCHSA